MKEDTFIKQFRFNFKLVCYFRFTRELESVTIYRS